MLRERIEFQGRDAPFKQPRGAVLSDLDVRPHRIAHAASPGCETCRTGRHVLTLQPLQAGNSPTSPSGTGERSLHIRQAPSASVTGPRGVNRAQHHNPACKPEHCAPGSARTGEDEIRFTWKRLC